MGLPETVYSLSPYFSPTFSDTPARPGVPDRQPALRIHPGNTVPVLRSPGLLQRVSVLSEFSGCSVLISALPGSRLPAWCPGSVRMLFLWTEENAESSVSQVLSVCQSAFLLSDPLRILLRICFLTAYRLTSDTLKTAECHFLQICITCIFYTFRCINSALYFTAETL